MTYELVRATTRIGRALLRASATGALSAVVASALLSACTEDPTSVICADYASAGVNVKVIGGAAIIARGLKITATLSDGAYSETLQAMGSTDGATRLAGAWERAGLYSLVVQAPGYQDFKKDKLVVNKDACHVIPVSVEAELTSAS